MIFNAPKNYKNGKFILNRFRKIDVVVILSVITISIIALIVLLNFYAANLSFEILLFLVTICLLPIGIVYLLYLPMRIYFNFKKYLGEYIKFRKKQKHYRWEGIYISDEEES